MGGISASAPKFFKVVDNRTCKEIKMRAQKQYILPLENYPRHLCPQIPNRDPDYVAILNNLRRKIIYIPI